MSFRYAIDIAKDIIERGTIEITDEYVTGEEFEKWLCTKETHIKDETRVNEKASMVSPVVEVNSDLDVYDCNEEISEAA